MPASSEGLTSALNPPETYHVASVVHLASQIVETSDPDRISGALVTHWKGMNYGLVSPGTGKSEGQNHYAVAKVRGTVSCGSPSLIVQRKKPERSTQRTGKFPNL